MARSIHPADRLVELRTAALVARLRGMHAEADAAGIMADTLRPVVYPVIRKPSF